MRKGLVFVKWKCVFSFCNKYGFRMSDLTDPPAGLPPPAAGPGLAPTAPARALSRIEERLIHVETADGLTLDGLLVRPRGEPACALPMVLWLHGLHLSFSAVEYVAIARALAALGVRVITANTRGHAFGTWLRGARGPLLGGSGWERFQDCRLDVAAWLGACEAEGERRVILAGHGYGATKAVYAAVRGADPRVAGVIAASAGSLIREAIPPDQIAEAEMLEAQGRGADLMPWGRSASQTTGASTTFSAQVIANRARLQRELYGSDTLPPILADLAVPLLAFFGAAEQRPTRDVQRFLDTILRNAVRAPSARATLIPEAGYFYTGCESRVAGTIAEWMRQVFAAEQDVAPRARRARAVAGRPA
jgi:hypothetical protein